MLFKFEFFKISNYEHHLTHTRCKFSTVEGKEETEVTHTKLISPVHNSLALRMMHL